MNRLRMATSAWLFAVGTVGAATYYVDDDAPPGGDGSSEHPFQTIREGVEVAGAGDEVIVRDGMYVGSGNRGMLLSERYVTIRSEHGPENCIIDCEGEDKAFMGPIILIGVTIINGRAHGNLWVELSGGAVSTWRSGLIQDCVFRNNSAASGGAVFHAGSISREEGMRIVNCVFEGNSADGRGGAIANEETGITITDCAFTDNVAGDSGGAIDWFEYTAYVQRCTFRGNAAPWGSQLAISQRRTSIILTDCDVEGRRLGTWVVPHGYPGPPPAYFYWEPGTLLDNFAGFASCWEASGPNVHSWAYLCERFDLDHDEDVDLKDFARWTREFDADRHRSPIE